MMAGLGDSPLLFLDVDGPLIPFRARPPRRTVGASGLAGSSRIRWPSKARSRSAWVGLARQRPAHHLSSAPCPPRRP
jgi:hypothetical protein